MGVPGPFPLVCGYAKHMAREVRARTARPQAPSPERAAPAAGPLQTVVARATTAVDRSLIDLQRLIGNRAATELLAGPAYPARPRLQRKPTQANMVALTSAMSGQEVVAEDDLLAKLRFLQGVLGGYLALDPDEQDGEAGMEVLGPINDVAHECEDLLVKLREARGDNSATSGLGAAKKACEQLVRESGNEQKRLKRELEGKRYTSQVEPATLAALSERRAKYLTITPRPGTEEAEATGGSGYPQDLPPERRHALALPPTSREQGPFSQIAVQGQASPNVLDVLAVAGNHGGVERLFEQSAQGGFAFSKTYWRDSVIGPLVQKGVQARMIVLDACLTASMIDVFKPLCAPGGKIICSMYSINASLMTPEVWATVTGVGATNVSAVVTQEGQKMAGRASEFTAEGLADTIRLGAPDDVEALLKQEPTIAPLISQLRYLPKMISALEDAVRQPAQKETIADEVLDITSKVPAPDEPEVVLAAMLGSAILAGDFAKAQSLLEARLRDVVGVQDQQLAELVVAFRPAVTEQIKLSDAAKAPSHLAVYDQATNTLRYDEMYDQPNASARIQHSTGAESAKEVRQLRGVLARIANEVKSQPVPASDLFL